MALDTISRRRRGKGDAHGDDNVLDLEVLQCNHHDCVDTVIFGRIGATHQLESAWMFCSLGNVSMDENVAGLTSHDGSLWHSSVCASDPQDFRSLSGHMTWEELVVSQA